MYTNDGTVRHSVPVGLPPEPAFAAFVELRRWWPREYTWSREALADIGIEARPGGLCYERGPHGFRYDWGRVVRWEPGSRLAFTWQIGPDRVPVADPAAASLVEVKFTADGDHRTRVDLTHRDFDRHGPAGAGYARALDAPQGWPYLLDRFRAATAAADSGQAGA